MSVAAFFLYLAAVVGIAAFFHLRSPNLGDADALYHYRHAALYASGGPFITGFPWTTCSVLSRTPGDLWYGFHLLLVPFTWFPDALLGIKLAGICGLVALMLLCYAALARLRIPLPYLWPFLMLFSSPPGLLRLIVTRPHVLSMGLLALLLALLVRGALWEIALVSFAVAFIHLNLFWIVLVVALIVLLVRWRVDGRVEWSKGAAALAGVAAGWLLRPEPLGTARNAYVQLVELSQAKLAHVPLMAGGELSPVDPAALLINFAPFLILWLGAIALLAAATLKRREEASPEQRVLLWSTLTLSICFFELSVLGSLRATDQWKAFSIFLIGGTAGAFPFRAEARRQFPQGRSRTALLAAAVVAAAALLWRGTGAEAQDWAYGSIDPNRYRDAASWLRKYTPPGSVVFHAGWGAFPDLFYWNPQNRYINGMDPIFMYSFSPVLYWEAHHLAAGRAARVTCPLPQCRESEVRDTYQVLTTDFKASYLFVEKPLTPLLYEYGRGDPRFRLVYDDDRAAVFALVPASR